MKKNTAEKLILKTGKDYDLIARKFSLTRNYLWDEMKKLLKLVNDGDRVLDFGCGSGRIADALIERKKGIDYSGVDVSGKIIQEARKKHPNLFFFTLKEPFYTLPFDDNYFNVVFAIAVFHHIPSGDIRKKTVCELKRVLKKDGLIIVSVWSPPFKKLIYPFIKYTFLKFIGKIDMDIGDVFIPWKNSKGEVVAERYVHFFSKGGLRGLFGKNAFSILRSYYADSRRNIYLIGKKDG